MYRRQALTPERGGFVRDAIEAAITDALVRELTERALSKLRNAQKKALVVCTGSGLSFLAWLVSLQQLQEAGFTFDLFLSRSAANVLDVATLRQGVSFGRVWQDDTEEPAEQTAGRYPTVIVPAMTIHTAAKVAGCMADTPASRIVFGALTQGKNVIISVDGCCPDNEERAAKGYVFTEPLRKQLQENIARMKAYGATLATAETLASRTLKAIGEISPAPAPNCGSERKAAQNVYLGGRKIIGRQDVASLPAGATLHIAPGSQITQLAIDTARLRGIQLIEE